MICFPNKGFVLLSTCISYVLCSSTEFELITYLLSPSRYDTNVRPVKNPANKVTVEVAASLRQIIDMDEVNQRLTLKLWLNLAWQDDHLTWNVSEYGGIKSIRIIPYRIWRPDITLYEDVAMFNQESEKYVPAIVEYNGRVKWNIPKITRSSCLLDVTYFPWDQQACPLKFGSWTYNGGSVHIKNSSTSGEIKYYVKSGEWDLLGFAVRHHDTMYSSSHFPDVTFWLVINRKGLYYLFNLVLPCAFITATTVLVFYLPPDSGEKVSLGVTVLLALTVFLLLVAESMPPQSQTIPLMGAYFAVTIVLLALSTALTVVILNVHYRGTFGGSVPRYVQKLVLNWLARILFMKEKVDKNRLSSNGTTEHPHANEDRNSNYSKFSYFFNGSELTVFSEGEKKKEINQERGEIAPPTYAENLLLKILNVLQEMLRHDEKKENKDSIRRDWMLVAMVLDRFLLIFFSAITLMASLIILLNHSYSNNVESIVDSIDNTTAV